jgi:two-component system chemotaxis response regulator CheY
MRSLIVEDEFTSRMQLKCFLEIHGSCDIAVNGEEALEAIKLAIGSGNPYTLICLDIKIPGMDGFELLKKIRDGEEARGLQTAERVKIFMTTGVRDPKSILKAYYELCDEYLSKPIDNKQLNGLLKNHALI